jgi:hypothetical protein
MITEAWVLVLLKPQVAACKGLTTQDDVPTQQLLQVAAGKAGTAKARTLTLLGLQLAACKAGPLRLGR